MRNRKSLVQVHVADITTAYSGIGQTDLGIEVGTIQVHLTTVVMDDLTSILYTMLEDTKGRGVRDL